MRRVSRTCRSPRPARRSGAARATARRAGGSPFAGDIGNALWTLVDLRRWSSSSSASSPGARSSRASRSARSSSASRSRGQARPRGGRGAAQGVHREAAAGARRGHRDRRRGRAATPRRSSAGSRRTRRARPSRSLERARREIEIATETAIKELYTRRRAARHRDRRPRSCSARSPPQDHERLIAESIAELRRARRQRRGRRRTSSAMATIAGDSARRAGSTPSRSSTSPRSAGRPTSCSTSSTALVAASSTPTRGSPSFFASPLVDAEARRAALERRFRGQASDLLVDALQVHRPQGPARPAARRSPRAYRQRAGLRAQGPRRGARRHRRAARRRAARRAARAPSPAHRPRAVLVERVDPALLGGLVVAIGDQQDRRQRRRAAARGLERRLAARPRDELVPASPYVTTSA